MSWVAYALLSAVFWGATYLVYEIMLKKVSAFSILFFSTFGSSMLFLCALVVSGGLKTDWQILKKGSSEAGMIALMAVMAVAANICFLASIRMKNATISGLIEITYPLFTALFAWVFLKQVTLSTGTVIGALLIMTGIICISYFEKIAH